MKQVASKAAASPTPSPRRRRRRLFRFCLRWTCVGLALLVGGILLLGYFLNRVGLPGPIKNRLVAELRQHGWEVQFSRLRLRWYRGLVAEDLQLQRTNRSDGPIFLAEQAQCPLSHAALGRLRLLPSSIQLQGGRLCWAVDRAGRHRQFVDVRDIRGQLRFQDRDTWELQALRATYRGLHLKFSGTLTNASAIRDWTFAGKTGPAVSPKGLEYWLDRVESISQEVSVEGVPELDLVVHGDARAFQNFYAGVVLRADALASPWGQGTDLHLSGNLATPRDTNDTAHARIRISARNARTPWAAAEHLELVGRFAPSWTELVPTNATIALRLTQAKTPLGEAAQIEADILCRPSPTNAVLRQTDFTLRARAPICPWGRATNARLSGVLVHSPTNWIGTAARADVSVAQPSTRWGRAETAQLQVRGAILATNALFQTNLPWAQRLADFPLAVDGVLTNYSVAEAQAERLALTAEWQPPRVQVTATAYQKGHVDANVNVHTGTREATFQVTSSLSPAGLATWLNPQGRQWLQGYTCQMPPRFQITGRLVAPVWTNRAPDWPREVLPRIEAAAQLDLGRSSYRGVEVDQLFSTWSCTNGLLQLEHLTLARPEGELQASGQYDLRSQDFALDLQSRIDPGAVLPWIKNPKVHKGFARVAFDQPPRVQVHVQGNRQHWQAGTAMGTAAATNILVNGEFARNCTADFRYTNQFLSILHPQIQRDGEQAVAAGLGFDFANNLLYLTNATGNLNAYALMRAINPKTARLISRYEFAVSPSVTVTGVVGLLARDHKEDLHLDIDGGPFHWHVFHLPHIAGHVHVRGRTAELTNVVGQFYDGTMRGGAFFDWSVTNGTDAAFYLTLTNGNLRQLMADVSRQTNDLEGQLSGRMTITSLNSETPDSWQGYGSVVLRDGLIWDIPVFGVVSKMLNAFIPGLGYSRAKQATADFVITNSVIHTSDLDIRATGMRVHYEGTVGFDRQLDALVEAELLRDMPGVGYVVSRMLMPVTKLFELQVTGTWDEPRAEPRYVIPNLVSKIILVPFRPLSTLKGLFIPSPGKLDQPEPPSP